MPTMRQARFTRRQTLLSAAALAVVACTPGANTGASPSAAGRAVAPFRWIFGFTIQANPSMPVIIAKELGYFDTQDLKVTWDFVSPSATGIRLMGTGQYEAGSTGDVGSVVTYVNENLPIKVIAQQSQVTSRALAVRRARHHAPKDFG